MALGAKSQLAFMLIIVMMRVIPARVIHDLCCTGKPQSDVEVAKNGWRHLAANEGRPAGGGGVGGGGSPPAQ